MGIVYPGSDFLELYQIQQGRKWLRPDFFGNRKKQSEIVCGKTTGSESDRKNWGACSKKDSAGQMDGAADILPGSDFTLRRNFVTGSEW